VKDNPPPLHSEKLLEYIKTHFDAVREVRRGVCLLNAGEYDKAANAFTRASRTGCSDKSLPAFLGACLIAQGHAAAAASCFAKSGGDDAEKTTAQIRHNLALWAAGKHDDAIATFRENIRENPECAELHFQLGTLLTSIEQYEEAELRFTQTLTIDREHAEALVSLALCCAVRNTPAEALTYLQRAQARKPHDARIGLLLAQAANAMHEQGCEPRVRAVMPDEGIVADQRGMAELSHVIEAEPDFVDAFLSIPVGEVDEQVFAMLLETIRTALERQPEHAELHYHCGRVLTRLGRREDAIGANERAVEIEPRYTQALIELGKLYQQTDRTVDAATRLEQAVAAGAKYADVFYMLGNLYRTQGEVSRARSAYRRALLINDRYEAAVQALASLPA